MIPSFIPEASNQGAGVIRFLPPLPIVAHYRDFAGVAPDTETEVLSSAVRLKGDHSAETVYGLAGGALTLLTTLQYAEVFGAILVDSIVTPAAWRDRRVRPASAYMGEGAPPASGYLPAPARPGSVWHG